MYKGAAIHIRLTGSAKDITIDVAGIHRDVGTSVKVTRITATIDVSAYQDLCLHRGCDEEQ